MWKYTQTDELIHFGIPGMKWGKRKAVQYNRLKEMKTNRENRDTKIQKRYDNKIEKIEKGYKKFQLLSDKDQARSNKADNEALNSWEKSKNIYKKEKAQYKSDLNKAKQQTQDLRSKNTINMYNKATYNKAAKYMVNNKMTIEEATKKAKGNALRNTAIALAALGAYSIYALNER